MQYISQPSNREVHFSVQLMIVVILRTMMEVTKHSSPSNAVRIKSTESEATKLISPPNANVTTQGLSTESEDYGNDGGGTLLNTNSSVTDLVLHNTFGCYDSKMLRQRLNESQFLQHLKLGVQNWSVRDTFFQDFADGLERNQSLRSLHLTPGRPSQENTNWSQRTALIDLSSIIAALSQSQTLEELKLDCEFATRPTLTALSNFVQQPHCPLNILEVTCYTDCWKDVRMLIRAVKKSPHIQQFDLSLRDPSDPAMEALDCRATFALISEALEFQCTQSSLINLSVCNTGLEQPLNVKHLAQILQKMKSNTHLESLKLKLWYKCGDRHFDRQIKSFCTRNKAVKMAAALEHTEDPATTFGSHRTLLADIERCGGEAADLHLVNLWYSLLLSRPHEIERYVPSTIPPPTRKQSTYYFPNRQHAVGVLMVALLAYHWMG